ncbi:alpha/beta hydrolase [Flagellimonas pacifica]|uniref:Acetyl esterase/lipase n=1 Tax=Flagellimonas pacifica TaxID=1247520 RepID=A0A285MY93_9FLAO|nr:alpha/beta hydrolase [Allomuricauda parva]SNZ01517.1 Acetyl esterase/lipase [Allomuricauda parva]
MYIICTLFGVSASYSQGDIIPLWPNGVPNQQKTNESETQNRDDILWIENVQQPTLEVFLPTKRNATGKAMIICPGGGYQGLAYDWEGTDIAKWLNSKGIAAFVLKYRLPLSKSIIKKEKAPLQDVQRALRIVRHNSSNWNIVKNQIGIMGFSAGGHLASTLSTRYEANNSFEADSIDHVSARPDFTVLIYPVITMKTPNTHLGSRNNLLGENPPQELADHYSNELHVDKNSPPTFIVHSTDDEAVPVENSLLFYKALKKEKVPTEMHIYPHGGHGYSLAIGKGHLQTWTDRLAEWLQNLK